MSDFKEFLAGKQYPDPWQTPEQHAWEMNHFHEREIFLRKRNNMFELWRYCDLKRCTRAKSCVGHDPGECGMRFFPHMPDEFKLWLRHAIELRRAGVPPEEACRRADAEVAAAIERVKALEARRGCV
jgi:hypothetical protein